MEQFVFEVLVVFVESLALAHADEKSMGKTMCFLFRLLGILYLLVCAKIRRSVQCIVCRTMLWSMIKVSMALVCQ